MKQHDSYWSWLVAFGAFVCAFNTMGFSYSMGIYFTLFKEEFGSTSGTTSLVSALNYGLLSGLGPVTGFIVQRWGCCFTLLLGSFVASSALILTSFGQNITWVVVFMGGLNGVGYGLSYTTLVVIVNLYFNRFRRLAVGLFMTGSGVGMIVYPYLSSYLIKEYGWRFALPIIAAIQLNNVPVGLLARNPPPLIKQTNNVSAQKDQVPDACQTFVSVRYVTYAVSCFLAVFGHIAVTTHLGNYVMSIGYSSSFAKLLISVMGFAGLFGRMVLGLISQMKLLQTPTIFGLSLSVAGLCILLTPIVKTYIGILVLIAIFGICISSTGPTMAEMAFILSEPELFTYSYGYAMFACGIGSVIGPPIAGVLYDLTNIYAASFYLGGAVLILSGIQILPQSVIKSRKLNQEITVSLGENKPDMQ